MISYFVSLLLVSLASICNSIIDKVDHHQSTSVFSKFKNQLWWNSDQGWRNKYVDRDPKKGRVKWYFGLNKPVQLTDSWHFFKMWMIVFLCTSISLAIISDFYIIRIFNSIWDYPINFIGHLIITGTIWNVTFTSFYHRIWNIKKANR